MRGDVCASEFGYGRSRAEAQSEFVYGRSRILAERSPILGCSGVSLRSGEALHRKNPAVEAFFSDKLCSLKSGMKLK